MEWATFQLDGEDAIVLGPGADGRTGGALVRRDGFRSSASADTLLVEKSGHPPIRIPLARVRRDSVVVRIDTSSRSTWNDTVSRLEALYDERDGQVYRTFRLGRQRWLSENLNHATPGSWWYKGDLWASTGTTWLDDSSKSGTKFGRFYTWAQAMGLPDSCDRAWCHAPASQEGIGLIAGPTRQGVCPNGWHVPADSEWIEMLEALTREYSLASPNPPGIRQSEAMRARNSWTHSSWEYPVAATDRAGFRALPSGSRAPTGSFSAGAGAGWWVSNEYNAASCVFRYTSKDDLKRYVDRKTEGRSLRCVED